MLHDSQAQNTFQPALDERSLRLAAQRQAERAVAGGVARAKEQTGAHWKAKIPTLRFRTPR